MHRSFIAFFHPTLVYLPSPGATAPRNKDGTVPRANSSTSGCSRDMANAGAYIYLVLLLLRVLRLDHDGRGSSRYFASKVESREGLVSCNPIRGHSRLRYPFHQELQELLRHHAQLLQGSGHDLHHHSLPHALHVRFIVGVVPRGLIAGWKNGPGRGSRAFLRDGTGWYRLRYRIYVPVRGVSAQPTSALDKELGYPCHIISVEQFSESTSMYAKVNIRTYVNLAATALLVLLGIGTLIIRYKGQSGKLLQIMRRDGGLYYLSIIAIRLCNAVIYTPTVVKLDELETNPLLIVIAASTDTIVAILAQRLLSNMRKVDYMGSQPVASKLLFAPPPPGSEDDSDSLSECLEMAVPHPSSERAAREAPRTRSGSDAGPGTSRALDATKA